MGLEQCSCAICNTDVPDAGLVHFGLTGTKVTDPGIAHLDLRLALPNRTVEP
jgi:hypothetical protein